MASQMSAILRAGTPLKRRIICVINPKNVYPVTNAAKALLAIAPTLIRSIETRDTRGTRIKVRQTQPMQLQLPGHSRYFADNLEYQKRIPSYFFSSSDMCNNGLSV